MITTRTRAHRRRTAIATAVTVLALISAGCSAPAKDPPTMPPAPAASTGVSTGASTPAPGSGLKSIDQGALQALVDATIKEQLIPGAVVVLDTPQGDFTATSGTTERGVDRPPDARDPLPDRLEPKTMTSAVVLQLAQEGKLGLQDPVSKYVSGVPGGENITVAELLKMRSGLYNYTNSPVMATSIDDDPTKAGTRKNCWTSPLLSRPISPPTRSSNTATPTTRCSASSSRRSTASHLPPRFTIGCSSRSAC